VLLDDLDSISNMVAVTVSAQEHIDVLYFLLPGRARRVVHDPGIDNDGPAARSNDAKCRVAQPGKLNDFKIHRQKTPADLLFGRAIMMQPSGAATCGLFRLHISAVISSPT